MNSPLNKYFVSFLLLVTISFASAQSIEEEIAKKSCECIQSKVSLDGHVSNSDTQKCIKKSGDEVLKSKRPARGKKAHQKYGRSC